MLNIGPAELLVVAVVALVVLGPTNLPEAARQAGRAMAEVRKVSSGFQSELRGALHEPVDRPAGGDRRTQGEGDHADADGASPNEVGGASPEDATPAGAAGDPSRNASAA